MTKRHLLISRGFASVVALGALLVLIMDTSGCGGGSPRLDMTADSGAPDLGCPRSCAAACAMGQTCVVPGSLETYTAFCAKTCTTDVDCGGMRCAALFNKPGTPPVCLPTDLPTLCPGVDYDPRWHCDFPPASCKDAQTLQRGFSQPKNQVCGTEYVFCTGGCAPGGSPGAAATCK